MKSILIICVIIAFVYADLDAWHEFKKYQKKNYDNNTEAEKKHFENFKINHQNIIEHNSQPNITYTMDHNAFSIYSDEDFKKMYLREMNGTVIADQYLQAGFDIGVSPAQYPKGPDSISYQQYCLPVRKQGTCGACWAFAASAQVETVLKRRNGAYNTFLSPQYLLNCAKNTGCNGVGSANVALAYLNKNGLVAEENYPYLSVKQACRKNPKKLNLRINGFTRFILNGNEQQLVNIVASVGPVAIAVFVLPNFQFYKKGIYNDAACPRACGSATNHIMLLVGYGVEPGTGIKYWLIKNSWGTSFGEQGYVKMFRGNNRCNIACFIDFAH